MRTVLALDEMLAKVVKPKLPGEVEVVDYLRMKEWKTELVPALRALVLAKPSVLAIGARAWNGDPLDLLRELRLPYTVPVVLLAKPGAEWSSVKRAEALRVYSIVPTGARLSGLPSCVATECQLAWKERRGPKRKPVLLSPSSR